MSYYSDLIETAEDLNELNNNKNNLVVKSRFHFVKHISVGAGKKVKCDFWASGSIGSPIRDAISGYKTHFVVGSADEDFFFKVMMCNGFNGQKVVSLFYDSPEQFENHQHLVLLPQVKERWLEKQNRLRISIK